jgi:hypothetical protein
VAEARPASALGRQEVALIQAEEILLDRAWPLRSVVRVAVIIRLVGIAAMLVLVHAGTATGAAPPVKVRPVAVPRTALVGVVWRAIVLLKRGSRPYTARHRPFERADPFRSPAARPVSRAGSTR